MRIFMSYSSRNRAQVLALVADLRAMGHEVWIDQALSGGQSWWDEILTQIRACEAFVFALSPQYINSIPCQLEIDYAQKLNRLLVPVQIADVAINRLPSAVQSLQLIDCRTLDKDALIRLVRAINLLPDAPILPNPLPPPPDVPISRLAGIERDLQQDTLDYSTQDDLLARLTDTISTPEGDDARLLLHRLRQHPQVSMRIAQQIDELLARDAFNSASSTFAPIRITKGDTAYHFEFTDLAVMHSREHVIQWTKDYLTHTDYRFMGENDGQYTFQRGEQIKRYITLGNPRESGDVELVVSISDEYPTRIDAKLSLQSQWGQVWLETDFQFFQTELSELRQTLFQGDVSHRYSDALRKLVRYESYWESAKIVSIMLLWVLSITLAVVFIMTLSLFYLTNQFPDVFANGILTTMLNIILVVLCVGVLPYFLTTGYMNRLRQRIEAKVLN